MSVSLAAAGVRAILLDIEGTTTPVDFVHQVLFPYARAHVEEFVRRCGDREPCRAAIAMLTEEANADASVAWGFGSADVVEIVHAQMDRDRKSRGLKALQGLIWEEGYRTGELRGQVYDDVPVALERWMQKGRRIFIYSSGSVLAQQLLFRTTAAGDLTGYFSGYFDTAVGPKTSAESYRLIVKHIGTRADRILFVSDSAAELAAARESGIHVALCVRATAQAAESGAYPVVRTFDEITD